MAQLHRHRGGHDPGRRTDEVRAAAEVMLTALALGPGGPDPRLLDRYRAAHGGVPDAHLLALARHAVGMRVLEHAERVNSTSAVRRALVLLCGALSAATPDHPHLDTFHSNRGSAYWALFERTGERSTLDAAVADFARAAGAPEGGLRPAAAPHGGKGRATLLSNLGAALSARFEVSGGPTADLAAALHVQRQALRATARDDPDRALYQSNLGSSLVTRFEHMGDVGSLAEAMSLLADSLRVPSLDGSEQAYLRSNMARALLRHFERTADTDALRAALDHVTQAVSATPHGDPARASRLGSLAAVCLRVFDRTKDDAVLDSAEDALYEALSHPHRLRRAHLDLLGVLHQRRYDVKGGPEHVRAAVSAYEEALALTPAGHPGRPGALSNLGNALIGRYRADRAASDLDRAVGLLREAVRAPTEDPDRCRYLTNLGAAHAERAGLTASRSRGSAPAGGSSQVMGSPTDDRPAVARHPASTGRAVRERERALAAYAAAAGVATAPALGRARAALYRGRLAASVDPRRSDALDGYRHAVGLLETLAWFGLARTDQEQLLREFSGVAAEAAACAIAQGRHDSALELLEQGRGVLLAQAVGGRGGPELLDRTRPLLARRLRRLQSVLERRTFGRRDPAEPSAPALAEHLARTSAAAADREALLKLVRRLPGLERFLLPPDAAELRGAAEHGPVVVVNVSGLRCDALVVTTGGVRCIPLPGLSRDRLHEVARAHLRLVAALRRPGTPRQRAAAAENLRETLAWLWGNVAEPVLTGLGLDHRDDGWPRLWWCPTGPLAVLPLHAAQRYDPARLCDTGVTDRVVSSYTPTLRSLIASRERPASAGPTGDAGRAEGARDTRSLLAVCVPRVPGRPHLRHAAREVRAVHGARRPGPESRLVVLAGRGATRSRVTAELHRHRGLLFVGHSSQDPGDPGRAALYTQDGPLTMREIAALRLRNADLAYLSSCESALGDPTLPDEALSLAGALQIAGFRQVVANLWSVLDMGAPEITGGFFARRPAISPTAAQGDESPATALHAVLRSARLTNSPLMWAGYCHTGR
ncbi:CHAT domain-containing protein [Streptomyces cyaneofuscatus]|uniref:CHAT domain-containing protein n=1 Tax=Streptomyces cyaneofuscatus TaxID=66883 RepID=A0ABZ1F5L3_9ACTN|nr:CHAT domain-containing protein [Streptomyces cyaneofuscatus]WSB11612.1 CHAT domain-containing protein [Streptomyces cyaneofuscatus]WSD44854.1 CHAT domain-containing protein [Streptomyces cyaneofuscatus]